tara:strand:+ start:1094 stop:2893 length:1800 start_codon:yes stop_codon:yes gene_type:complete
MADRLKEMQAQQKIAEDLLKKEQRILEDLREQGASQEEINKQLEYTRDLEDQVLEIKRSQKQAQLDVDKAIETSAANMDLLLGIGTAFVGVLQQARDVGAQGEANIRRTADALGKGVTEATALHQEALAVADSWGTAEITVENIVNQYAELQNVLDGAQGISMEMAKNLGITADKLGIGYDESAKMVQQLMLMDGATAESAERSLFLYKNLADAANVDFGATIEMMVDGMEDLYKYTGMSTDEMYAMTVQARKMGYELDDMIGMSQSLLDTEGRIEKQMIFNQITGKNINLDKAAQLALEDDLVGMMAEVENQLGDINDLSGYELRLADEMLGGKLSEVKAAKEKAKLLEDTNAKEEEALALMAEKDEAAALERAEQIKRETESLLYQESIAAANANMKEELEEQGRQMLKHNNLAQKLQYIQVGIQIAMAAQAMWSKAKSLSEKSSLRTSTAALAKNIANAVARGVAAAGAMATAAASTLGAAVPFILAALVGAGIAMVAMNSKIKADAKAQDAIIGPDGGMIVSGPKGSIQLDKKDSIIAGTDLGIGKKGDGGMNIGPLIAKMDELISAVKSGRIINVDGYRLNEALHLEKAPAGMI